MSAAGRKHAPTLAIESKVSLCEGLRFRNKEIWNKTLTQMLDVYPKDDNDFKTHNPRHSQHLDEIEACNILLSVSGANLYERRQEDDQSALPPQRLREFGAFLDAELERRKSFNSSANRLSKLDHIFCNRCRIQLGFWCFNPVDKKFAFPGMTVSKPSFCAVCVHLMGHPLHEFRRVLKMTETQIEHVKYVIDHPSLPPVGEFVFFFSLSTYLILRPF
jgi:hypothetical protein